VAGRVVVGSTAGRCCCDAGTPRTRPPLCGSATSCSPPRPSSSSATRSTSSCTVWPAPTTATPWRLCVARAARAAAAVSSRAPADARPPVPPGACRGPPWVRPLTPGRLRAPLWPWPPSRGASPSRLSDGMLSWPDIYCVGELTTRQCLGETHCSAKW